MNSIPRGESAADRPRRAYSAISSESNGALFNRNARPKLFRCQISRADNVLGMKSLRFSRMINLLFSCLAFLMMEWCLTCRGQCDPFCRSTLLSAGHSVCGRARLGERCAKAIPALVVGLPERSPGVLHVLLCLLTSRYHSETSDYFFNLTTHRTTRVFDLENRPRTAA
jgi:hypothetical protein